MNFFFSASLNEILIRIFVNGTHRTLHICSALVAFLTCCTLHSVLVLNFKRSWFIHTFIRLYVELVPVAELFFLARTRLLPLLKRIYSSLYLVKIYFVSENGQNDPDLSIIKICIFVVCFKIRTIDPLNSRDKVNYCSAEIGKWPFSTKTEASTYWQRCLLSQRSNTGWFKPFFLYSCNIIVFAIQPVKL